MTSGVPSPFRSLLLVLLRVSCPDPPARVPCLVVLETRRGHYPPTTEIYPPDVLDLFLVLFRHLSSIAYPLLIRTFLHRKQKRRRSPSFDIKNSSTFSPESQELISVVLISLCL